MSYHGHIKLRKSFPVNDYINPNISSGGFPTDTANRDGLSAGAAACGE